MTDITINKLLEEVAEFGFACGLEVGKLNAKHKTTKEKLEFNPDSSNTKDRLYTLIRDEVIGEDDYPHLTVGSAGQTWNHIRNDLRAEQRKALAKIFGRDSNDQPT